MTSIFQIDWILVDTIIIILLLLLLLGVRIFKITHRWRYSFSNQTLEHKCLSQVYGKVKSRILLIKKRCLPRKASQKESDLPLILIFRMNKKRKLLRVLTEGLSSYGFTVINVKAKIKHIPDNRTLIKTMMDEWKVFISAIIKDFKLTEITFPKFILLNGSINVFTLEHILSDSDSIGAILINPRLGKKQPLTLLRNSFINTQLYSIFSRKSILIFKNKHLHRFVNEISSEKNNILKYISIENATYSFKYYETILLGMIIDIIENKLLKSKN